MSWWDMRISVADAAKRLGTSPDFVRWSLQKGTLPIGHAVRNRRGTGYRYFIFDEAVERWMNGQEEDVQAVRHRA